MYHRLFSILTGAFFIVTLSPVYAVCTAPFPNANVAETTPSSSFTDNGDGTVSHALTGLMWKQCAEGLSGANCGTGTYSPLDWAAALNTATSDATAGYGDWRLPNQRELLSLLELCGASPAINMTLFPNTPAPAVIFWSGSSYVLTPVNAWVVNFGDGNDIARDKSLTLAVRLVRGGQLLDTFDTLAPDLTAVTVTAISDGSATLAVTSDLLATGYWMVVPQGSAAPTAVQVKAGNNYGAVTVAAFGSGALAANAASNLSMISLAASTNYDVYLVAYEANNKALSGVSAVAFSTTAATTAASSGGGGGGGSFGLWALFALFPLMWAQYRLREKLC